MWSCHSLILRRSAQTDVITNFINDFTSSRIDRYITRIEQLGSVSWNLKDNSSIGESINYNFEIAEIVFLSVSKRFVSSMFFSCCYVLRDENVLLIIVPSVVQISHEDSELNTPFCRAALFESDACPSLVMWIRIQFTVMSEWVFVFTRFRRNTYVSTTLCEIWWWSSVTEDEERHELQSIYATFILHKINDTDDIQWSSRSLLCTRIPASVRIHFHELRNAVLDVTWVLIFNEFLYLMEWFPPSSVQYTQFFVSNLRNYLINQWLYVMSSWYLQFLHWIT